jgi:hypothetical protein
VIDEEGVQYEAQKFEKLPYKLSDDTLYGRFRKHKACANRLE